MPLPAPQPGTVTVWTDVSCGWATVALHRFYTARERLGLADEIRVDTQLFFLEDINRFPIPKRYLDVELPVVGALEPGLGWKPWQDDPTNWPITMSLPNEAVHAAKQQSARAAEDLDMALRLAFFRDSRPISLLHVVLEVAETCSRVDAAALQAALDDGRARGAMMAAYRKHAEDVEGSPHFVFADGYEVHNPGIELHWEGDPGTGFPVVDKDDAAVYEDLVRRAAG